MKKRYTAPKATAVDIYLLHGILTSSPTSDEPTDAPGISNSYDAKGATETYSTQSQGPFPGGIWSKVEE